jgi:hypothetical protein
MGADCLLSFGRRKRVGNNAFFYTKCIRPHTDATTAIPPPASNSDTNRARNTLCKSYTSCIQRETRWQEQYNNTGDLNL